MTWAGRVSRQGGIQLLIYITRLPFHQFSSYFSRLQPYSVCMQGLMPHWDYLQVFVCVLEKVFESLLYTELSIALPPLLHHQSPEE